MKVIYLKHSGFLVELEKNILIFDYYKGILPKFPKEKKVFFLSSHRHYDHFRRQILDYSERLSDVFFVFSDDIPKLKGTEGALFMGPNEERECEKLLVKTLRSTDEGVAFLIQCEGKWIYHAGDLNWWHWEEEGRVYNEMMRRNYQYEISKLADVKIDLAFQPLDKRQQAAFYMGFDWFMRHTDTKVVFPMHFWEDYTVFEDILSMKVSEPYRDKIQVITQENQEFIVGDEHGQ